MCAYCTQAQISDRITKANYLEYVIATKEINLADTNMVNPNGFWCGHNDAYKVEQFDELEIMKAFAKSHNLKATKKEYEYLIK